MMHHEPLRNSGSFAWQTQRRFANGCRRGTGHQRLGRSGRLCPLSLPMPEAGGAGIDERGVASLVNTLQAPPIPRRCASASRGKNAQRVIDTDVFTKGDMLGYFNVSTEGDFDGKLA